MYLAKELFVLGTVTLKTQKVVQFAIVGIYGKKDLKVNQLLDGYRKGTLCLVL